MSIRIVRVFGSCNPYISTEPIFLFQIIIRILPLTLKFLSFDKLDDGPFLNPVSIPFSLKKKKKNCLLLKYFLIFVPGLLFSLAIVKIIKKKTFWYKHYKCKKKHIKLFMNKFYKLIFNHFPSKRICHKVYKWFVMNFNVIYINKIRILRQKKHKYCYHQYLNI